jgi:hypothetical protein
MKKPWSRVGEIAVLIIRGASPDDELDVKVRITDYKNTWSQDRWEVTPVEGDGSRWAEESSLSFNSRADESAPNLEEV